ncbi:armadillo repeat protein deleted in velo-cardio-facial syndrome homolog isoform X1 [Megalobrama amblycephala]|uniref:armadillo repeat protein deleted in velo-cardio-facial syndrome homolog isoform X1 n=1 Tax=Megalobrama amblycephala TaxID=75352 RepID=UPI002013EFE8|nr:armadillo repeat protein deleted in velo-cardio-facial syndrome homolog isoform X1 [Megalobrama amblycephala]XP_048037337.1 armadillo repeat protein deleted in velo-cardio-facial syndrome homolog isoform X1 [Megalobrama amblycephala]
MPAEVKEKPDPEEPPAEPSNQDTKEKTEEVLPAEETADAPSSDVSTVASHHTETHTESSGIGTEKSSSPDSETNPLSSSSSNEQVVPNVLKESPRESSEGLDELQTTSPDAQPHPEASLEKEDARAVLPPHPETSMTSDLANENPKDQSSLYGTLNSHGVTLLHGFQYHPSFPTLPARNYLPENCYTLPLHRCASKAEQDGIDLRSGVPSHPIHHMRPTLDLTVDEHLGPLPHAYFQDLYRTVIPQKRASMVSLDTIRKDPRWRDPNLREVIAMLSHPMDPVKSNAAAYLQHLCYENDKVKQDVRQLRGIPVLVGLLDHPKPEVHRKACGALRNISFGRDNFNKVAIKNSEGIPALLRLLRKSNDGEVRELVTGTLWNLSSHEPLKMIVINHGLQTLTDEIIIPHSGLRGDPNDPARPGDPEWNTVFKNTSGCLRNVSSDGAEARQRLRECEGLVDALLHALYSAVAKRDINNKASSQAHCCVSHLLLQSVENCVCILRNLSYHVHKEVPGAEKFHIQAANHSARSGGHHKKKEEPDCFGGRTSKEEWFHQCKRHGAGEKKSGGVDLPKRSLPMKGLELLYQPEVVRLYLSLLKLSQNHNTLEAAAGALQNLSAGHWAWSSYIRATVRKEKGLPVLVELLHSDADKVVRAIAIALRNLAIDHKNKDLIGSYAMRDLVSNLPCGQQRPAKNLEGDTVVAVLNTILEIVSENLENARFLIQGQGIQKLVSINRTSQSVRETKAASHILQTVWAYKDLRHTLLKAGWNKTHFKPAVSSLPKKQKNAKQGSDDITLPLMEKNQDGYCTADQAERAGDAPCHMIEREAFQGVADKRPFIRTSRPAVGLVERTPQPLDSWV